MRLMRIHTIVLSLAAWGCGGTTAKKPTNETDAETAPIASQDPNAPSETGLYQQLAEAAVIRVALDASGQEVPGSASMKIVADEASIDRQNPTEVEKAFLRGDEPKIAQEGDELDKDSSAQSWADYSSVSNYATYQPRVYQQGGQSYYDYSSPTVSQADGYRYYYYNRPNCPGGYCPPSQPNSGYSGGSTGSNSQNIDQYLMSLLRQSGVTPLAKSDFLDGSQAQYELGRMLFFDPLLSGNRNTACATCHVPEQGTSNAMSLGPTLQARQSSGRAFFTKDLLPRNSPGLFNRGHRSYISMFWDSRVLITSGQYVTPAGDMLPPGLNSALAAQALFPLASRTEMLGCLGENELANAGVNNNFTAVWAGVVERVKANQQYTKLLLAAFPDIAAKDLGIQHLANALAIFQSQAWRADQSAFDRYVSGQTNALSSTQKQGAIYFYGKGRCGSCHSGVLLTDQSHHNIAMPQFGPGIQSGYDLGFGETTGQRADYFAFKTPSLRNVTLTGPWGHNGAYNSLRGFINHYRNPVGSMKSWDWRQIILPFAIQDEAELLKGWRSSQILQAIAQANPVQGVALSNQEIDAILAFLDSLTDPRSKNLEKYCPQSLPSGYKPPQPFYPRSGANAPALQPR